MYTAGRGFTRSGARAGAAAVFAIALLSTTARLASCQTVLPGGSTPTPTLTPTEEDGKNQLNDVSSESTDMSPVMWKSWKTGEDEDRVVAWWAHAIRTTTLAA